MIRSPRTHRLLPAALLLCLFVAATAGAAAPGQADAGPVAMTSDGPTLNVTIPVFDTGVPSDPSVFRELQIFPRIREAEAKLLPFLLREALVESGQWGAVRVATKPEAAAELQVSGTILRSDGDWLDLHIVAIDATGRTWLDKTFSGEASEVTVTRQGEKGTPEFRAMYDEIGAELAAARDRLGGATVANIKGTSLMRYAVELAPSAFGDYLEQTKDGTWRLLRLPARDDPMLMRIELIRNTEFLITDTVDTKYKELNADISRTYRVWRGYRRKFVEYQEEDVRFAQANDSDAPRGSWEAIKHQYDAYKYERITAQEQDRLAVAFNNEVTSTVDAMETRVAELEGWVEQGYLEWRSLLEDLHEVESRMQQ